MNSLFQDVRYRNMLVHSGSYQGSYLLQLIKNNVVVKQQVFGDWNAYRMQYRMVVDMVQARANLGY